MFLMRTMKLPHQLVTLFAAALCWLVAGWWAGTPADSAQGNPLALRSSAFGSLIARLMKDSLHSYWHGGQREAADVHDATRDVAPAGRLLRPRLARPAAAPPTGSWIAQWIKRLAALEDQRTTRNSPFAIRPAHRRYLSAAADRRVQLAWQFDPGDAALYEIAHFTAVARAATPAAARQAAEQLARQTIAHAFSPRSGLAEALTGAGAAINLLNDQLQPGRSPPATASLRRDWEVLAACLKRYRELRQQATEEAWWSDIPPVRQQEIESYSALLGKIAGTIRQQLETRGILNSASSH